MCLSCGCGSPNDNHGDTRNITLDNLDQAAQAAGIGVGQVAQNIVNGWHSMSTDPEASGEQHQQVPSWEEAQQADYTHQQAQGVNPDQNQPGMGAPSPGR